jgi:endonuclease/exonuclease/phosphatase family metal-dependent hydrolase
MGQTDGVDRLRIGTLNIRNIADRWDERLPLLLADMASIQPDILGLQEVVYPMQQDRLIGSAGEGRYESHRAWAGRPEYGNALLVRVPLVAIDAERVDLGRNRSAIRAIVELAGDRRLLAGVTHLHHVPADESARDEQVARLLEWFSTAQRSDAQIVVGDFNAEPDEPAARRMRDGGFRSAYADAHGADHDVTWPSGLEAPAMDTDGPPGCLDYIWIRGSVRVLSARLAWDRPAVGDPTLYPSDHIGLVADVEIGG